MYNGNVVQKSCENSVCIINTTFEESYSRYLCILTIIKIFTIHVKISSVGNLGINYRHLGLAYKIK